jgi:hypothetical protein
VDILQTRPKFILVPYGMRTTQCRVRLNEK